MALTMPASFNGGGRNEVLNIKILPTRGFSMIRQDTLRHGPVGSLLRLELASGVLASRHRAALQNPD